MQRVFYNLILCIVGKITGREKQYLQHILVFFAYSDPLIAANIGK